MAVDMAERTGSRSARNTPAAPGAGSGSTTLATDVRYVKGVGERIANLLRKLDIITVGDLLQHYPSRYEDRTRFARVASLQDGQNAVLRLRITEIESRRTSRRNMTITRVAAEDDTGTLVLVFFNQPWMKEKFVKLRGREVIVYGQVRYGRMGFEMNTPSVENLSSEDESDPWSYGKFVPVYPLTEGLDQARMRTIMKRVLESCGSLLPETLPQTLRKSLDLPDIVSATRSIHWAETEKENLRARRRLVFDEFFHLQIALARIRRDMGAALPGISFHHQPGLLQEIEDHLSFDFTEAQKRVIEEIWADMARPYPMNRLVQGDVGSGKTVVALASILLAARNGYQSALMAPTEVLAEQHFLNVLSLSEKPDLRVALLSGGPVTKAKQAVYAALEAGHLDLVVGTHALLQEDVRFHKLGLVVVDEQHKFGVKQRGVLRDKGESPDMLVMTATPIPRTLTMTVYGDLDLSIINELPPGRKPVRTHWKDITQRTRVYEGVRALLEKGGQVYVVCPLVEESENLQARAAVALAKELQNEVFPDFPIGLLHGQMKRQEKQEVIQSFREGGLRVLVCTTVVEVGVDVPSANAIVIESSERYGLAQLHQLRGRVGRSDQQSFCVLLCGSDTPEARQRMEVMERTTDGFEIAEADLSIRGPGEFFGTRQSGLPEFKIADVLRDIDVLELARAEAQKLVDEDPEMQEEGHRALAKIVKEKYQRRLLETVA